jgi:hypothetical protein
MKHTAVDGTEYEVKGCEDAWGGFYWREVKSVRSADWQGPFPTYDQAQENAEDCLEP